MNDNKLFILLKATPQEVFTFALNPANTPLWIDSIVEESTNEKATGLGTIYRNRNRDGEWSEYVVTTFEPYKVFELRSKDGNYHVRYTLKSITPSLTELSYYEWVEEGDLEEPFSIEVLNNLKRVLEKR